MKNKQQQQQQQPQQQQQQYSTQTNLNQNILQPIQQQSTTPSPPLLLTNNSPSQTYILTRSAAQRFAANTISPTITQHNNNNNNTNQRSNSRISISSTHNHHQNNSHINNGKIVKPIALRASSSSSSVSSISTNLSASQQAKNALIATALLENSQQTSDGQACTCLTKPCKCTNFSLIAKYFASFPANRLKQTTSKLINSINKNSPFAIPQSVKNKDAELCKHFNHCVKLSDTPPPASITAALATVLPASIQSTLPSGCGDMPATLAAMTNSTSTALPALATTQPLKQISTLDENLNDLKGNDNEQKIDAYNQITMETRLTRKFLIKYHHHHPYLQNRLSNDTGLQTTNNTTTANGGSGGGGGKIINNKKSTTTSMELRKLRKRPSINLIKMKNTKLSPILNESETSLSNSRSNSGVGGGSSNRLTTPISNDIDDNLLVKFIDAPNEEVTVDDIECKQQQQQQHQQQQQQQQDNYVNNKKRICNCNATIQQYTNKTSKQQQQQQQQQNEDLSSICGSKSSNADADSGYYSDFNFKLNDNILQQQQPQQQQAQQQSVLPKHNYYTRYNAATTCTRKLNCSSASSTCTCDLDLNQIEND